MDKLNNFCPQQHTRTVTKLEQISQTEENSVFLTTFSKIELSPPEKTKPLYTKLDTLHKIRNLLQKQNLILYTQNSIHNILYFTNYIQPKHIYTNFIHILNKT